MIDSVTLGADLALYDLRDRPDYLRAVIEQNLESWGELTDLNPEEMAAQFPLDVPRGELPITFIATLTDRYAGCVSLRSMTLGAIKHPEVYGKAPLWLSNMWVGPAARGHGIAGKLTERVLSAARAMGHASIHSSTATEDSLYHKMGFRTISSRALGGHVIYLIERQLATP